MSDGATQGRHAWIEPGVFEVAPGVHRIPLPLPSDGLRAVNVYAIEDGGQLVLIDSGWALEEARDQLETALGKLGYGFENVRRFLVTHVHRDHYTLGVTLRRTFGTSVSLGIGEQPSLENILAGRADGQASELRRWGAGELAALVESARDGDDKPPDHYEMPDDWIEGTAEIELTTRTLRAVPTPGHTRGHVVFVDANSSLLFSGDHVLPHITPSIGLEPARAELPLGDYLDSLRLMHSYPDMHLLPAHGPIADSVHTRVDELLAHHDERLKQTEQAIRNGAGTAHEAALKLGWTRHNRHLEEMDEFNRVLAIGETAAHLDVLVARGSLRSSTVDGVVEYRTVAT
ncbi:glyoxylase-like metal-dependent hydrolase (beta-lactamase superfamily II) [Halopolyspora algeriensis]|uniref:Glyoxylase-like metal-dependent hydrolase (Beta-lactamase superfamily II) n=1 Tax=Halopolyspora algeriensis TaxID=1500506 RepID=A0A368VRQ2_9ACTN|nr:MBL fold metallo-hydrolase [Halopolyspora algeriensis]RCW44580.1 glyoxylase-like metal-dependent hydrolase (beta-lactamase superfamily II) [Halopolyspora algeriensis]TQM55940.1 glyoxylase-like metal-dependent hydrolase (beta-lactamase superfamily II) [Halopolyspora algeriensis]